MRIIWTEQARAERDAIWSYVAAESQSAAVRLDDLFSKAVARLSDFPQLGKPGVVLGTREIIPHESYRLIYTLADDEVRILTLIHAARQWPPLREEAQ